MRPLMPLLAGTVLLGLTACASGPRYDTSEAATELTAAQVTAAPASHKGAHVVWGGVIVATRNQPDYTEVEILSYPLDSNQRPDTGSGEQGRFLAHHAGYLESVDYAPGRRVTLRGKVANTVQGKVGDAPYTFPVVQTEEIYLWSRDGSAPSSPSIQFGIGVIFSR